MNIPTNPKQTHNQPTIKRINFVGAEPFLVDEFYIILEKLINLGRANKVAVSFNTNLTVLPTEELNELLKKCKRVDVLISVDDIEERYEILRYPGKWKLFLENIQKIKQQGYRLMSYNVISSLNLLYVPEFYNWAIKNFSMEVHSQFAVDKKILDISIQLIDEFDFNGDFIESQAFGYLAIRSYLNKFITFPSTTGVKKSCLGGSVFKI